MGGVGPMAKTELKCLLLMSNLSIGMLPAHGQASGNDPQTSRTIQKSATAEASDGSLAEIVITALRRETPLQKTPASVVAVQSSELASRGISDLQSLASAVPEVSFGEIAGETNIAIRGIGSLITTPGQEPRVAVYEDGVYIARPTSQLAGFFDIDQLEVLEGPQGTIYGRNATAGAITLISHGPTDTTNGYVNLSYGNYNAVTVDAAVGGPVMPTVSGRAAIHFVDHDGYGTNLVTGQQIDNQREGGARFSLLWTPYDGLKFLTIADFSREGDNSYALHYLGQPNANNVLAGVVLGGYTVRDSRDIASDSMPITQTRMGGVSETITFDTPWASIKSITAYRDSLALFTTDLDGTSLPLANLSPKEDAVQYSQEFQFNGKVARVDWLAGAYFFREVENIGSVIPLSAALVGGPIMVLDQGFYAGGGLKTDALAPYLRISYDLSDSLTLTAGGRYNWERKSIDDTFQFDFSRTYSPDNPIVPVPPFPRSAHATFDGFVPSATLDYKLSSDVFLYATYSEGFKSGGFNVGVSQPAFLPEKIKSEEVGVKTTWLNHHLMANLSGFHYDYRDLQVSQIMGDVSVIQNAASATINGLEFTTRLGPFDGFSVDGSVTYIHSKFNSFVSINPVNIAEGPQNLAGNQLPQAPNLSSSFGMQQVWSVLDGELTLRGDYTYVSRNYFTPFDERPLSQAGYGLGSSSIDYRSPDRWTLGAYIRNIGDKLAVLQSFTPSTIFGAPVLGTFVPPRTYGIHIRYDF